MSEGGSVPTITSEVLDGGHGASAPLPALRISQMKVITSKVIAETTLS
jgi:hypothetical protein